MDNGTFSNKAFKDAILSGLNTVFFKHSEEIASHIPGDYRKNGRWGQRITLGDFFTKAPVFQNELPNYEPYLRYKVKVGGICYVVKITNHKLLELSIFTLFIKTMHCPITSFAIANNKLFIK